MAPIVFNIEETEKPRPASGASKLETNRVNKVNQINRIQMSKVKRIDKARPIQQNMITINGESIQDFNKSLEACRHYLSSRVNTKGDLWDIALRTLNLMKCNRKLQTELAQLQEETQQFLATVMANPENQRQLTDKTLKREILRD